MMKKLWKKFYALGMAALIGTTFLYGCGKTEDEAAGTPASPTEKASDPTKGGEDKPTPTKGETVTSTPEPTVAEEVKSPAEAIVGYFTYYYTFGDTGTEVMPNFFHFYEPDPVMGNIFVAEFAYNQVNMAGRYEVKEEEIECTFYENREAQISGNYITKKLPYTVVLYDMEGKEQDICGFDGKAFYATTKVYTFQGAGEVPYTKETPEESEIGEYLAGEVGISYETWIYDEDDTCFVTLFVNRSYDDLMEMMENGKFTMESGEAGLTYHLDTGAVLVNAMDGTGTYTSAGGTEYKVHLEGYGAAEPVVFAGTFPYSGMDADVTLRLISGTDCEVYLAVYGQEMLIDGGTYTVDENGVYHFTLQGAGEIASEIEESSQKPAVHYVYNLEALQADMDLMLVLSGEAASLPEEGQTAAFETMLGTFPYMGADAEVHLNLTSTSECEIYLSVYGQEMLIDGGTYTVDENGVYHFTLQGAGEIASEIEESSQKTALHYVYNLEALQADMDLMLIAQ